MPGCRAVPRHRLRRPWSFRRSRKFEFIKAGGGAENTAPNIGVVARIPIDVANQVKNWVGRVKTIWQTAHAAHDLKIVEPLTQIVKLTSLQILDHVEDSATGSFERGPLPAKTFKGICLRDPMDGIRRVKCLDCSVDVPTR